MLLKGKQPLQNKSWIKYPYRWGLYVCSRKIKTAPMLLEALSNRLYNSSHDVEANFLHIGQSLQSIYEDSIQVTQAVQNIASKMSDTSGDNVLKKVEIAIRDVEDVVACHRTHVATSLDQVRLVIDQLSDLFNCCHTIERIAMNLRVVGLNIGVESTRSVEAREMFTVVSEEIIHLSEKVAKLGGCIRDDVEFSQQDQERAFDTISNGLQSLDTLSHNAHKAVQTSMAEIENCINSSKRIFDQTGDRFNEVSNQVGELVAGMQFHDNMRQRIEHISKALSDAVEKHGEQNGREHRFHFRADAWRLMDSVISLQQLQLSAVISEIDDVYSQSVLSFETIDNEITSLIQSLSGVSADRSEGSEYNTVDMGKASDKLAKTLSELNHLLTEGEELTRMIDDSVDRAGKIGDRFTQHLKEVLAISFETQIKALNAIVKAGHLDEQGRTLEVLAQEMNNLSKQTEAFVSVVEDNLNKMGQIAMNLKHQIEDTGGKQTMGKAALLNLSESLINVISEVSSFRDQLRDHTMTSFEMSERLGEKIQQSLTELGFLPVFEDAMSVSMSEMEKIAHILKPFAVCTNNGIAPDAMNITDTYTMERERDIHQEAMNDIKGLGKSAGTFYQSVGKKPGEQPKEKRGEETVGIEIFAEKDEDEFGENVELF